MTILPDEMTIGEAYGPALTITDPEEAQEYLRSLTEWNMRLTGNKEKKAREIEESNISCFAAHSDSETYTQFRNTFFPQPAGETVTL